ncbi:DUF6716 putative glycosyltransferase [Streptomyces sp. NPDC058374]|uniref:DUF6716 putative glycosyltransferase n=1 Tax=Streptomyces sp. NPDC058374 TaxID=3346466 RepID=UPI0036522384
MALCPLPRHGGRPYRRPARRRRGRPGGHHHGDRPPLRPERPRAVAWLAEGGLLVLDLGVHERYGNQVFLDSGLLRTFRQIADDRIGVPAPAWRDGYFHGAHRTGTELIADRVEELPVSGERPSRAVWETDYFRSAAESHLATTGTLVPRQPPLARRRQKHGPVKGTMSHVAYNGLPPVVRRRPKRWARERQLF